ncbi:Aliphatic sulfonates import ATP-binding protein SsuB [Ensifer psoraleae]|uniref:ABC transporter ATP-binding protein n=1 Tax=Sinorhizobium psoraleae TaxID=520838 RepID=UPI001568500C|nr:ABC transporter ATP-binding protein [Sinorhizobium psoraleae]NRP75318.1 Aliphatic sulfonates import ATP-binding protein SsuB [Sinorhizobium psoraleae]
MSNSDHLRIREVTREFNVNGEKLTALDSVSLNIAEGEFVTIVGASGCGKSTLLRLAAGLDTAHAGRIAHDGNLVTGPSLDRGMVFQEPRLFPWLTVERNVALGLENSGLAKREKKRLVEEHLELVGLSGFAKAYPHQLSGGMAQRAGIARGLVNRPNVLFLDEPFGALDAITKTRMQDELQEIWARERITMVLVTHDVEEAVYLGDRVVIMSPRPGRIRDIVPVNLRRPRERISAGLAKIRTRVLESLNSIDSRPTATDERPVKDESGRRAAPLRPAVVLAN